MDEARRRMLLAAMHIDVWLPREPLPYAAPSNESVLAAPVVPWFPELSVITPPAIASENPPAVRVPRAEKPPVSERRVSVLSQTLPPKRPTPDIAPAKAVNMLEKPPRFAVEFWQSGSALLVLDVSNGQPLSPRAPAYYLLSDILRAVGLPDKPQSVTEPVIWPLLRGSHVVVPQGQAAACRYVHTVLQAQQAALGSTALWLIGDAASRFSQLMPEGALPAMSVFEKAPFGTVVCLPALQALMETPALKREVWQHLRPLIPRWISQ